MLDPRLMNHEAFSYYARLRRVKEYFELHPAEKLSLQTAARIAGSNDKYFSAFFHAKTGLRFRDWVTWTRIGRATDMMRKGNDSISTIALAVGYRDLRTFERAFKRCTSMTPRRYKQSVRPIGGKTRLAP